MNELDFEGTVSALQALLGQVVSVTGTWMQNIAMAWLVLELTHSPVAVGHVIGPASGSQKNRSP